MVDGTLCPFCFTVITRTTGNRCSTCGERLPLQFGKSPIRYIPVVGTKNAGKTVFLYQLIATIKDFAKQIDARVTVNGITIPYMLQNKVGVGHPLPPQGTSELTGQIQPIVVEFERKGNRLTCVLYDVPGGLMEETASFLAASNFSRVLEHADGLVYLLDSDWLIEDYGISEILRLGFTPVRTILRTCGNYHGGMRTNVPTAICITKCDNETVIDTFLGKEMYAQLMYSSPLGLDSTGAFDVRVLNGLSEGIERRLRNYAGLLTAFDFSCETYATFACSALKHGCDNHMQPIAPIESAHIEDPLCWLLCKFGFMDFNDAVFNASKWRSKHSIE